MSIRSIADVPTVPHEMKGVEVIIEPTPDHPVAACLTYAHAIM